MEKKEKLLNMDNSYNGYNSIQFLKDQIKKKDMQIESLLDEIKNQKQKVIIQTDSDELEKIINKCIIDHDLKKDRELLLSAKEVAHILKRAEPTIKQWCRRGILKHIVLDGKFLIRKGAIDELVNNIGFKNKHIDF